MQIHVIAVGGRMPAWVESGCEEYIKRMPKQCRLRLNAVAPIKRTPDVDIRRLLRREGERLMAAVPKGCRVIALEREGKGLSTEQLADELRGWLLQSQDVAFLLGGPEGISDDCLQKVHAVWSLSQLTLAHPLARVLLVEQLYRAWSITQGMPYHR
jgi:23S rRNA (pseudouridine1915-N3)-methyltransferase